jgi:GntR family transcriptional regulator/MocR family aminotransferase
MRERTASGALLTLPLEPATGDPLFRQVYAGLRQRILDGALTRGARLPATRALAVELGVSRNTVLSAYGQLLAEGYLNGRVGSGTYVAPALPEDMMRVSRGSARLRQPAPRRLSLSRRGEALAEALPAGAISSRLPRPFRPCIPALDAFPFDTWARLVIRHHRRPPKHLLSYGEPAGHAPLRRAIAQHLGPARAVHCDPEQVVVIGGSQPGLDLVARLLLDPSDAAWVEDPGYPSARAALRGAGVRVVPVRVDGEGLDVAAGQRACPDARLVLVTPSHQFPLGVTMSLSRRLALLDWARRSNAWIVEDDYDSEFRYAGRSLAALQGLDRDGRVIYLGTFSKTLFPSLRLGYLVVPRGLVDAVAAARAVMDRQTSTLMQAVVADFMAEGHFLRHIRRMRKLYAERQEAFLRAVKRDLAGVLEAHPCETGLHLIGWLAEGRDDREASQAAARTGIEAPPLSSFCVNRGMRGGLLMGYAASDPRQIRDAVRRLRTAWPPHFLRG